MYLFLYIFTKTFFVWAINLARESNALYARRTREIPLDSAISYRVDVLKVKLRVNEPYLNYTLSNKYDCVTIFGNVCCVFVFERVSGTYRWGFGWRFWSININLEMNIGDCKMSSRFYDKSSCQWCHRCLSW